jgi:hypothetical protein
MYEYATPQGTIGEFSSLHQLYIASLERIIQFAKTAKQRYVTIWQYLSGKGQRQGTTRLFLSITPSVLMLFY